MAVSRFNISAAYDLAEAAMTAILASANSAGV